MSVDIGDAATAVEPASASIPPVDQTPGGMLRAGREQHGLTVQQVADDLHLDVRLVRAIEANNFLTLGAPVYARGHLRKYASVLGLPPDLVIERYQQLSDVPVAPTAVPVTTAQPMPRRVSLRVPVLIVAGIVVAAAMVWLAGVLLDRASTSRRAQTKAAASVIPVRGKSSPAPVSPATAPQVEVPISDTPPQEVTAAEASRSPTEASPANVQLQLHFTESSWVEIYDAENRRLMYDIGQPGQTRTVAGIAPLRVTLGMASAVAIDVNNQLIPIPRRSGRDAARFTILPDGSIR